MTHLADVRADRVTQVDRSSLPRRRLAPRPFSSHPAWAPFLWLPLLPHLCAALRGGSPYGIRAPHQHAMHGVGFRGHERPRTCSCQWCRCWHPLLVPIAISERLELPNGCNTLLVDVAHVAGSHMFIPDRRSYAVRFGAAAMHVELPTLPTGRIAVHLKILES